MEKKSFRDFWASNLARRFAMFALSAGVLTACLMTIDESKLGASAPDEGDDSNPEDDGSYSQPKDAGNGYVEPPVKDAEAPITTDDGGKTCSQGLTLCPDDVCYDVTGDQNHCGSCSVKCAATEACKGSKCGPPGSCKDLLAKVPATKTGVSNLTIAGSVLPAYCDMDTEGGGFTMVYRVSGGVPGDPYGMFEGTGLNDDVTAEVTPKQTTKHYVSRVLGAWNQGFNVTDVRVRLLNAAGQVLKELKFDASGSSRESWYSKTRLKFSPWTDVAASAATNVFTPGGHEAEKRAWFITKPYPNTGCPDDEGWLVVHGTLANPACAYEQPMPNIKIFYASGTTAQKWSTGIPEAASFAIFAR